MLRFKIKVKNPKSDQLKLITGEIEVYDYQDDKIYAIATGHLDIGNSKIEKELDTKDIDFFSGDNKKEFLIDVANQLFDIIVLEYHQEYESDLSPLRRTKFILNEISENEKNTNSNVDNKSEEANNPDKKETQKSVFKFKIKNGEFELIDNASESEDKLSNKIKKLKVKQDVDFVFGESEEEELSNLELLGDEFIESEFAGLSEDELEVQAQVSDNQEDSDRNLVEPGDPVDIKPFRTEDGLLRLAGDLARELGKNKRVKYENLKSGYIKGIHGLCPQGTTVILAALTGIKDFGKRDIFGGNADWFSFKTPGTGGHNNNFNKPIDGITYYKNKVRIKQINGSWKGTFIDPQNSSKWQVGDIIACGYRNGKKYGHIQIWTGWAWMSDFKQRAIQQNNVDPDTVALWRLNENGLNLINNENLIS